MTGALRLVIEQPVTIAVGVIMIVLAGVISIQRLPIQLTPNVEDTIIAVTTRWEGASPDEVEREIIDEQEEKLQGVSNLRTMTSESQQGFGTIRLEFQVGTPKEVALREVSDKLREVPDYPENVDEPIVEASDPENRDYIAWIVFETTDPDLEIRTLQDFAEDRIKPALERAAGVSEINVLGGRERETQIRFDPYRLAQYGVTATTLVDAIRGTNRNVSAGQLPDGKADVRLRTVSQYETVEDVESTVIAQTDAGPIYIRDVAEVVETFKEPTSFVRSRGTPVIAINAQREIGANVIEVMENLQAAIARLNAKGGVLESEARRLGLNGDLTLTQVYDQTVYIDDALLLIRDNIWIGGLLATIVLLIFLRSVRSVGIVALAIPISVIGAVVVMVALGRSINVISLAGMAFATGLVVDNAIVVLENIFRHLEMGKPPRQAAYDGAREVWGAILAATLTTVFVFIPILLVQEEAGQLFRDIALAICAAVTLSLVVSITVIPTCAARILRARKPRTAPSRTRRVMRIVTFAWVPDVAAKLIYWVCGSVTARLAIVIGLTAGSVIGALQLMPPADYLPRGNRNLVFGLLIPPPGYNIEQQQALAKRIEETIEPYWEAAQFEPGTPEWERARANLPEVPTFNWMTGQPGDPVTPPPVGNYFSVGREGFMFHGAVSQLPDRVPDLPPLFSKATRAEVAPGVLGFAFQLPLFRLGGSTGSAIKIDFSGDDLTHVNAAALAVMLELMGRHGPQTVQPSPSNFNIYGPEIQVRPDRRRLADVGMTPTDLGLAVQANGDGVIVGDYRKDGDSIDLKVIAADAVDRDYIVGLGDLPIATPIGSVAPLASLAETPRITSPPQINHVGRQRSVTLQFTPPDGMPLEAAIDEVALLLDEYRAAGTITPDVGAGFSGSASKLQSVQRSLLGDGTLLGTLGSSIVLALLTVYLLMCVLFQSFLHPLVIMFSVPLATVGGFMALFGVFIWTATDRYQPLQTLDVLTMLGFVILVGVVVNNSILIVHQSLNFMRGGADEEPMPARRAIAESVRSRVRPIFMGTLTSVGGMAPLVLAPGSGSELYRGLGSVVVGGLLVSTIFTILLAPCLFSLVMDLRSVLTKRSAAETADEATPRGVAAATVRRDPDGV